jgi:hypothetical protein
LKAVVVSLETGVNQYFEHDEPIDFNTTAFFIRLFPRRSIKKGWSYNVNVLRIEIPVSATKESPWMVTK